MRHLAALVLAVVSARIETLGVTVLDEQPALRVSLLGRPGAVALHHEHDLVHLVMTDTELGPRFAGSARVAWTPLAGAVPGWLIGETAWLQRVEIEAEGGLVHLALSGPAGKAPELRADAQGLLVWFRRDTPAAASGPRANTESPAAALADQARRLFPAATSATGGPGTEEVGSVAELLPRLFPAERTEATPPPVSEIEPPRLDHDVPIGPFRLRASLDARYVDADTFVGSTSEPTRDEFLEVAPQLVLTAPLGAGRFRVDYRPALRAFASYEQVNRSSQVVGADLELSVGGRLRFQLRDNLVVGTLDTRVADPGGEYFSGLGRFRRNEVSGTASVLLGPRTSVELTGAAGGLRFSESSSFFDYDSRSASAGLGIELTPNLKAVVSYVYDRIPRPRGRPEAESQAHAARVALSGDIRPRLSGELAVGYRSQDNPNAGAGGRRYSGLVLSGTLTRQLSPAASLSLFASRSTPPSAYEANGFYVSTSLQGSLLAPLPLSLQLRAGLGAQRNSYRVAASASGTLRGDLVLGWFAGLRRPLGRRLFLSGTYRSERRSSNLDAFDAHTGGFVAQLEWDTLGGPDR